EPSGRAPQRRDKRRPPGAFARGAHVEGRDCQFRHRPGARRRCPPRAIGKEIGSARDSLGPGRFRKSVGQTGGRIERIPGPGFGEGKRRLMKILIAEDDPVSNEMLGFLLRQWGYEVVSTRNGAEAWAAMQASGAPSLAVLDWQMPELDGVEVCRRVRLRAELKHAYLLILTSMSRPDEIVTG